MRRELHIGTILIGILWLPAAVVSAEHDSVAPAAVSPPPFLHSLDNQPLEFEFRIDQELTPEVREFHRTRVNPYRGDADAIATGKKLYRKWCAPCHLRDGTGRLGPNLIDDKWTYPRTHSDQGKFEIIYAGGAGAMQAFGLRMDQDDILKVMTYLDILGLE